ncbi:recombinase [Sedimentimonas flavescens]|uniref:Recombinase n=1 Tax=Sedimentimonas flavescens TaxID=2851012 RepID=A0ABT2ZV08_9RHOB|nr:recombinase [Sedimentimonas flavescens]MCV2877571.1 recombinase [Sedimentimonas flavescens]
MVYWQPPKKYRASGYKVGNTRLPGRADDGRDAERAARARELTLEMLNWARGDVEPRIAPGTWGWLIARYKADDVSPFRDLKPNSRDDYLFTLARWEAAIGAVLITDTNLVELKSWQRSMQQKGRSHSYIKRMFTMLRIVAGYGVALQAPGARAVKEIMGEMRIKGPKARKVSPTPEQIAAIVGKSDEAGDSAFSLGILLQWWLTLRAVDVRGQYLRMTPEEAATAKEEGGIIRGWFRWADGITWSMIDRDVTTLTKTPSKTEETAPDALEFDLVLVPDVRARLLSIPPEKRVGPVIVDRKGMPFNRYTWSDKFRAYRTEAGVPDDVWMMDTRAGAINHAKRAGASPILLQHAANHASLDTTNRYIREQNDSIAQVIRLRHEV